MSREKRSAQVYQWGATVKGGWNFMNRAKEVQLLALKRATGLCIDGRRGGGGGAGTSHVTLWTWSNFASDAGACSSPPPAHQTFSAAHRPPRLGKARTRRTRRARAGPRLRRRAIVGTAPAPPRAMAMLCAARERPERDPRFPYLLEGALGTRE